MNDISSARKQFARRLRELRVPRGYRTARSLARALAIDENRYTRYERAEVEPDLAMIRRICEILDVTPNTLLGGEADLGAIDLQNAASQFAPPDVNQRAGAPTDLSTAAWQLAESAVDLLHSTPETDASAAPAPLATISATGRLYQELMKQPYEAISGLLAHPIVSSATPSHAQPLRDGIERFLSNLKSLSG